MLFPVQIAGFSVNLECQDRELADYLSRELKTYKGGDGDDTVARLSLEFVDESEKPEGTNGKTTLISHPFAPDIYLDIQSTEGSLDVRARVVGAGEETASSPEKLYSFLATQLFTLLLQYLENTGKGHVLLIHACGASSEGKGFIFAGASGKGKSTVAARLKRMPSVSLLGDELIAVTQNGGSEDVLMHSFPVVSEIPRAEHRNISVPLAAIFFLSPGEATVCEKVDTVQAATELIGTLIPPVPSDSAKVSIGGKEMSGSMKLLMDEAVNLASRVPCFHLSLSLEDEPWDQILKG